MSSKRLLPILISLILTSVALAGSVTFAGQAGALNANTQSLALAPAVIMVKAHPNASSTHVMKITNLTSGDCQFVLEAFDVVIRDGKRTYIPAGELPGGIARSAVFDPPVLEVPPGGSTETKITLTVPVNPQVRAVAAIFHGQTSLRSRTGFMVSGSLGTLITYNLSDEISVQIDQPRVAQQTSTSNLTITARLNNVGHEPAIPKGTLAILDISGHLVGRVAIEPHRLLPGEEFDFTAEYPHALRAGAYRAMMSFESGDGKAKTASVEFRSP